MQPLRILRIPRVAIALRGAAVFLPAVWLLSACNNGSGGLGMGGIGTQSNAYVVTNLVSNSSAIAAARTDPMLVNAWGLAFNPQAYAWVADAGSSVSTLYDGNGVANPPYLGGPGSITIPAGASGVAGPTGIVYNATSQFVISSGGVSAPAFFIYATLGGAIEGWAQTVDANSAVIAYDSGKNGAVYTGLTMGTDGNGNYYLYAADFKNDKIDVFNSSFAPIQVGGGFFDSKIPAGYAPYGIRNIPAPDGSAQIYVTYAEPSNSPQKVAFGAGLGYVAVFDWTGTLVTHLISQGALNAPWGLALAPSNFGPMSGALLVGNLGDGTIHGYNATTGASMGALKLANGQQIAIPGLWGIAFGNGLNSQPTNTLFFTSGPDQQTAGLYGRIDIAGTYTSSSAGASGGTYTQLSGGSSSSTGMGMGMGMGMGGGY